MTTAPYVVTFHEKPYRHYRIDGQKVPSVTQVLGIIDKPQIAGWMVNETLRGIIELHRRRGRLQWDFGWLRRALWQEGLTATQSTKRAAFRGTDVHKAYEAFGRDGTVPHAADFPSHVEGYVRGLTKFLAEQAPEIMSTEERVGSVVHGYAGTLDSVSRMRLRDGRTVLGDIKTSKRVYEQYHMQVEAYEGAHVEMGNAPTDERVIIILTPTGDYEIVAGLGRLDQFLAVLEAYKKVNALRSVIKAAEARAKREAKALDA